MLTCIPTQYDIMYCLINQNSSFPIKLLTLFTIEIRPHMTFIKAIISISFMRGTVFHTYNKQKQVYVGKYTDTQQLTEDPGISARLLTKNIQAVQVVSGRLKGIAVLLSARPCTMVAAGILRRSRYQSRRISLCERSFLGKWIQGLRNSSMFHLHVDPGKPVAFLLFLLYQYKIRSKFVAIHFAMLLFFYNFEDFIQRICQRDTITNASEQRFSCKKFSKKSFIRLNGFARRFNKVRKKFTNQNKFLQYFLIILCNI